MRNVLGKAFIYPFLIITAVSGMFALGIYASYGSRIFFPRGRCGNEL